MKPIWIAMLNLIIKLIDGQMCNNLLLIATKFECGIWKMNPNTERHSYHKYITKIISIPQQRPGKWGFKTNKLINLEILGLYDCFYQCLSITIGLIWWTHLNIWYSQNGCPEKEFGTNKIRNSLNANNCVSDNKLNEKVVSSSQQLSLYKTESGSFLGSWRSWTT